MQCKRCACGLHLLFCGALVWRPCIGSAICLLRLLKTLISLRILAACCFECSVKLPCIGVEFAHLSGFLSAAKRVQRPFSYMAQVSPQVKCAGIGQRFPACAVPSLHISPTKKVQSSAQRGYRPPLKGQSFLCAIVSSFGILYVTAPTRNSPPEVTIFGAYSMQPRPTSRYRFPCLSVRGYSFKMSMCFLSIQIWEVLITVSGYAVGLIADFKKRDMIATAVLYKLAVCIVQLCFNSTHFVFSPYCSFAEKNRKNIVDGVFINRKKRLVLLGFLYNRPESVYRKILSFLRFFCVPVRCRTHICKKVKVF